MTLKRWHLVVIGTLGYFTIAWPTMTLCNWYLPPNYYFNYIAPTILDCIWLSICIDCVKLYWPKE